MPRAGLPNDLVFLNGFYDGLLFGDGFCEGFFTLDGLFVAGSIDGDECVPVIRDGNHDGVDVGSRQHFAIVVIGFAILVLIVIVDGIDRFLEVVFVDVARGHDLAIF